MLGESSETSSKAEFIDIFDVRDVRAVVACITGKTREELNQRFGPIVGPCLEGILNSIEPVEEDLFEIDAEESDFRQEGKDVPRFVRSLLARVGTDHLLGANEIMLVNLAASSSSQDRQEAQRQYLASAEMYQNYGILTYGITADEFTEYIKHIRLSDWGDPLQFNEFAVFHNQLIDTLIRRLGGEKHVRQRDKYWKRLPFRLMTIIQE